MSVNSSCLDDVPSPASSNSSAGATCFTSEASVIIFAACSVTNLFLLPLFVSILFLGCLGWRRRPAGAAPTSLSDVFTYHSAVKQLVSSAAILGYFYGGYRKLDAALLAGTWVWTVAEDAQALIHVLACVERYLAVITPVAYRSLRRVAGGGGANVVGGGVWLLSSLYVGVAESLPDGVSTTVYVCVVGCFLSVVGFCSVSVLCALRAAAPGGAGGSRGRVHRCKRRAFNTITAILGALLVNFGGNTLANIVRYALDQREICVELTSFWFGLPSGLVLPLLFLQRAREKKHRVGKTLRRG